MQNGNENKIQIVRTLLQIGAYLQKTGNRITKRFGLTQQQFVVLNEIVKRESINQKQIVGALLLEKSNVSKIVKKLHAAKLINVATSSADARSVVLCPAKKGINVWKACMCNFNEWNVTWLDPLGRDEIQACGSAVDKLKSLMAG